MLGAVGVVFNTGAAVGTGTGAVRVVFNTGAVTRAASTRGVLPINKSMLALLLLVLRAFSLRLVLSASSVLTIALLNSSAIVIYNVLLAVIKRKT